MAPAKTPEPKESALTTIELSKPVKWGDKEVSALSLDLEGLSGNDMVNAEKEFLALNPGFVGVSSLTTEYALCVAARLVKRPVEDIKELPAKDCLRITSVIDGFLS